MKRLAIVAVLLGLLLVPMAVQAASSSYLEVPVWVLNGEVWSNPPSSELGLHAKAFISGGRVGICDKAVWTTDVTNHASVSQWINFSFGGTRWDWQIRKPGVFAADCIEFFINSNDDVNVSFSGFGALEPLVHLDGSAAPIAVEYSFGEPASDGPLLEGPPSNWYAAGQLPSFSLAYEDIKDGITKKLWNKLSIPASQRACDYENRGTITFTLTDVKYFINRETGDFNGADPGLILDK